MVNFIVDFTDTSYLKTGQTGAYPNRINWRCEMMLTRNQRAIKNKRVLDIASHDGRFSYACLKLGAKHVTGIEGRPDLVDASIKNLKALGYSSDMYDFACDDIFNKLNSFKPGDFDTILCFGFFYHTVRQIELLQAIKQLNPEFFILDTTVYAEPSTIKGLRSLLNAQDMLNRILRKLTGKGLLNFSHPSRNYMVFRGEDHTKPSNTIDTRNVIGIPTTSLVELLLELYGFNFNQILWDNKIIHDWKDIEDYQNKTRVSYISSR